MANIQPNMRPFADLVEEGAVGKVTLRIESIIMNSFAEDAARKARETGVIRSPNITMSETKRRFDIVANWFRVMRGDLRWSLPRVFDELPIALRYELDGVGYIPPTRAMWCPDRR